MGRVQAAAGQSIGCVGAGRGTKVGPGGGGVKTVAGMCGKGKHVAFIALPSRVMTAEAET